MFRVAYKTDIGLQRTTNQDAVLVCEDLNLCIVADGMGGHNAGEVASSLAVSIIEDYTRAHVDDEPKLDMIEKAFISANKEVYLKSIKEEECKGMGTTCSLVLVNEREITIGHVGDSRIYLLTEDSIKQLTEDHTLVESLIKRGEITRAAAKNHPKRNMITRALGTSVDIEVDLLTYNVEKNSKVLICSDGLTGRIDDEEILEVINNNTIESAVESLVDLANVRGGSDNITIVVIGF